MSLDPGTKGFIQKRSGELSVSNEDLEDEWDRLPSINLGKKKKRIVDLDSSVNYGLDYRQKVDNAEIQILPSDEPPEKENVSILANCELEDGPKAKSSGIYSTEVSLADQQPSALVASPKAGPSVQRRLCMGIDPGTTHIGIAWYDSLLQKLIMSIIDVRVHKGYRYKIDLLYLKEKAAWLVRQWEPLLRGTASLHIEEMNHPKSNKSVKLFGILLEQTIRTLHPEIDIHLTRPQDLRTLFGTRGRTYKERKLSSIAKMIQVLGRDTYRAAEAQLKLPRSKKVLVDGYEAGLYAFYGHISRAPRPRPFAKPTSKVNEASGMQYVCTVESTDLGIYVPGTTDRDNRIDEIDLLKVAEVSRFITRKDVEDILQEAREEEAKKKSKAEETKKRARAKKAAKEEEDEEEEAPPKKRARATKAAKKAKEEEADPEEAPPKKRVRSSKAPPAKKVRVLKEEAPKPKEEEEVEDEISEEEELDERAAARKRMEKLVRDRIMLQLKANGLYTEV